ncbi:MAG: AraC family transcriptional regulator [Gammaproteobacteria bacterium BRH_c0]|nr:MAG: AraC family transcriptional regulator [Gammaproteobacteria bacterium BRH_c0]
MATICMHHVLASLSAIIARGEDPEPLLARAGINPLITIDNSRRIHTDQVARLFKTVQVALDDEFMGLAARPCRLGAFRVMCDLVGQCRTLGELLHKAVDFYRLLSDDITMAISVSGSNAIFSIDHQRPELDPEHFLREFLLVIWHRFPSWYIGEAIRLRETLFSFPSPAHQAELQVMFPAKLRFSQPRNQLVFDAAYLDKPLVRSRSEVEYFVRNAPADVMTIPGSDNSLERQIERIIETFSSDSLVFPRLEELALQLGMNAQALYRQLKSSGTSYQKIKDDIRRETAIHKLINERLPVEQVSEFVGFSEARSFSRAFAQWTGMSPREYRNTFQPEAL